MTKTATAPIGTKYRLADGRILFVKQSFMMTWKAFYRVPGKTESGKDRTKETSFCAKCLPWRDTFAEAQADLDAAAFSPAHSAHGSGCNDCYSRYGQIRGAGIVWFSLRFS